VKQADLGPASFFEGIMSPIALANARTTIRGFLFCLAVVAVLLVSGFAVAQARFAREDFDRPTRISQWVHPLPVVANFGPATQGQAFSAILHVPGGLAPFRFWVAQGALPAGLSLNPSTGVIAGVPAVSGSFAFIVEATDSRFGVGRRLLQFNVAPGNVGPISITLNPQTVQVAPGATIQFTATVQNTSQTAVVWSASAGSIFPNGFFTAPITPGTAVVTAAAAGSNGVRTSANITVKTPQSAVPLSIATSSLSSAQVNTAYDASITAQGGTAPYTWSLISGSLPNGLVLNPSSGVIAGNVSQTGGFTFTAEVTDGSGKTATRQLTLKAIAANSGSFDGPAELPRTTVQSTMADTPAPGNTINVPAGANLQTIFNNANCGDTIQLQAGATFTGSFTLPGKSCDDNNWVVIRTSAADASLPAEGSRMNPCYAGVKSLPGRPAFSCPVTTGSVLATIVAPKTQPALMLAPGANHYRLGPGLEVTRAPGSGLNYALVGPSGQIDHLIVDRDWIHGTAQDDTTRGIFLSGITYAAVVDSYLNDFHCTVGIGACSDAQAISGGTGPFPQGIWKIAGNFLEASTENILFGGVLKNSVTPADITIVNNHLFKPLIWMPGQAGFVGGKETVNATCPVFDPGGKLGQCPFVVKNLFELKNAQRVLFEGNSLENVWPGFSQHGESVLLSGLNPPAAAGATVYSTVSIANVTVRFNYARHATSGMSVANMKGQGGGTGPVNLPVFNISIHDDIFDDINPKYLGPDAPNYDDLNMVHVSSCLNCVPLAGIVIDHITMLATAPRGAFEMGAAGTQQLGFTFTNNIVSTPAGLVVTGGGSSGCAFTSNTNLARLNACLVPHYQFKGNVLIGANNTWPAGNYSPEDTITVQFADYNGGSGGDYHLLPSSPYKSAGSDGKDLGANIDAVTQAIAGVD
jgi:hypothetical protein